MLTPDAGDKRTTSSDGPGSCYDMVAGTSTSTQHASHPPAQHLLHIDDQASVFKAGKVGGHQHSYTVTRDDHAVMSTADSRAPTESATPNVDDKCHI